MTNKEIFIEYVEESLKSITFKSAEDELKVYNFLENLKNNSEKPELTEKGSQILIKMRENENKYENKFKAKDIGEFLFVAAKAVSGSMRKLVDDGFVEKIESKPIAIYSLTEKGRTYIFDKI